jgi:hypothetical protein
MAAMFKRQGRLWDDRVAAGAKRRIAGKVVSNPGEAVLKARRSVIEALGQSLEQRLKKIASGKK